MDDAQARVVDAVAAADVRGDEVRDRDHAIARRHDGVVALLKRVRRAVGAVDRGHERPARAPRRVARAPGGRARSGVDEIGARLVDQRGEARDVRAHDQRVLARKVELDVACAGALELAHEPPARRGDDGTPARGDERSRNLDGAALDPARLERGQDLKDRRLPPFRRRTHAATIHRRWHIKP